jgi:transposase
MIIQGMNGLTREESEAIYEAGKERVVETLLSMSAKLVKVEQRIVELEGRLNQNSQNSHWPPSRDITKKPAPQSQRQKTGKPSGGQPGHEGTRLEMVEEPDKVEEHWPEVCAGCGEALGQKHAAGYAKLQVHDIPPIEIEVTEHRAIQVCCGGCGTVSEGTFPADVTKDVQYGSGIAALATYANVHQLLPLDRTTEL